MSLNLGNVDETILLSNKDFIEGTIKDSVDLEIIDLEDKYNKFLNFNIDYAEETDDMPNHIYEQIFAVEYIVNNNFTQGIEKGIATIKKSWENHFNNMFSKDVSLTKDEKLFCSLETSKRDIPKLLIEEQKYIDGCIKELEKQKTYFSNETKKYNFEMSIDNKYYTQTLFKHKDLYFLFNTFQDISYDYEYVIVKNLDKQNLIVNQYFDLEDFTIKDLY